MTGVGLSETKDDVAQADVAAVWSEVGAI